MIDQRAKSKDKIIPPEPLPYVSRRALAKIDNPAPIPTSCRYCEGKVDLVCNSEIYGREYGDWPFAYLCRNCGAMVGVHPNTDVPLGTLADGELRESRKIYKPSFQKLGKKKGWSRDQAYAWLAEKMGIAIELCHWGLFEVEQCEKAAKFCIAELEGENTPDDCVPVSGVVRELFRYKKYKPSSVQAKRGIDGRWQKFNGIGWDNSDPPDSWEYLKSQAP